jgi:ubiquitin-protein ligase
MIPIWVPKRRYPQEPDQIIEPEFVEIKESETRPSKECAICRRSNADYEHTCGVAFHKTCIQQYFDAISTVAGAERICPHCYAPVPLELDLEKKGPIEVSPLSEEVYNQYLKLSDEFSLALTEDRISKVSVFLNSSLGEQYFVNIDFVYYPKKPTFSFPDELLTNIDGLEELLESLSNWDPELPPQLVDVLIDIESKIMPKENMDFKEEGVDEAGEVEEDIGVRNTVAESDAPETNAEDEKNGFVEVFPEGEVLEVSPEEMKEGEEEAQEIEEILPATFFEIIPFEESTMKVERSEDTFDNEEAIQQYLDLSNSFSVELIDDRIYHVVAYLSCLDASIYNIYPITINLRDYPEKPTFTFTDDMLIRIRGLDKILDSLRHWDSVRRQNIVDILQELEIRLVEDSMIESEIEVIKREYRTRRLNKNRLAVTLSTFGPKYFDVELDIKDYPSPPAVTLPEDLEGIDVEELEGMRRWPEKPQKRIMDIIRSLSQVMNNVYRKEFEESLLGVVADEFEVSEGKYMIGLSLPSFKDELVEGEPANSHIHLKIDLPPSYPLVPPEISIDTDDEDLRNEVGLLLADMLKSWAPTMFLADLVNNISLSLAKTSLFKCLICGEEECPICGLALLKSPTETRDMCDMPCINCKRPYHIHCITGSIDGGVTECGYCLADLSRIFLKPVLLPEPSLPPLI